MNSNIKSEHQEFIDQLYYKCPDRQLICRYDIDKFTRVLFYIFTEQKVPMVNSTKYFGVPFDKTLQSIINIYINVIKINFLSYE